MKIILEPAKNQEIEVIIKGDTNSEEAGCIISALRDASKFSRLMLIKENESFLYSSDDIIYFYSAQNKTYAVTKNGKFEIRERLYELNNSLKNKGFIQINKSTVVNINFVKSITAEFSGNYTAVLKDIGETLIISRSFFSSFKDFIRK